MTITPFVPLAAQLRLMRRYRVDDRYAKRARSRLITSAAVEPIRLFERARFGRKVRRTRIDPQPVFLLGYGRSGTTHLHNLLWQDPRFGVVTNYQATAQPFALAGRGWMEDRLRKVLPETRPMDNVAVTLDSPQEEEVAMASATSEAPLHLLSFPRELPDIYDRYVFGSDLDPGVAAWKHHYVEVLQKATILSGGRRLVLKTPPNTGRIRMLLTMFPGARFVNIVRDPYRVHQSMLNMYRKIIPTETLQEVDWDVVDDFTVRSYRSIMERYIGDRNAIPTGQLVEIRYEDLDGDPLAVLEEIYGRLDLGAFESVRQPVQSYLDQLGTFEKNTFESPDEVIETVNREWGPILDEFGYPRRATTARR